MSMKHALMGLVLSGIGILMNRDLPNYDTNTPIEKVIRQVQRASRYRPAFNGGRPSVKRAQRQAMAKRAGRRARRLGHA
ncbi:hypothetical protein [Aeromonas tecta]|uniref:hypothetical protein n=1 Tax=Aeromonas tecta TaxID=324617 RepID=UPI0012FA81D7|nr:hypothetical protein [Aeromonas tecta]